MKVSLQTNHGNIVIELKSEQAPVTVANFVQYVRDQQFDGTIFHRVIDNFMIQGGGYTTDLQSRPTRPAIKNEADNGLSNKRGTVAMARTSDPHSASSQFFVNVADNTFLDFTGPTSQGWGYCVFGEVVDGMATVDKIRAVKTTNRRGMQDVPSADVVIETATLLNDQ
jgi:peptidyl-prolyl cis-trans isomerase B (cyclophilin B)